MRMATACIGQLITIRQKAFGKQPTLPKMLLSTIAHCLLTMNVLIQASYTISTVKEPMPSEEVLKNIPDMQDELRRPMFLIIAAEKK